MLKMQGVVYFCSSFLTFSSGCFPWFLCEHVKHHQVDFMLMLIDVEDARCWIRRCIISDLLFIIWDTLQSLIIKHQAFESYSCRRYNCGVHHPSFVFTCVLCQ